MNRSWSLAVVFCFICFNWAYAGQKSDSPISQTPTSQPADTGYKAPSYPPSWHVIPSAEDECAIGANLLKQGKSIDALSHFKTGLSKALDDETRLICLQGFARTYIQMDKYDLFAKTVVESEKSLKTVSYNSKLIDGSEIPENKRKPAADALMQVLKKGDNLLLSRILLLQTLRSSKNEELANSILTEIITIPNINEDISRQLVSACSGTPTSIIAAKELIKRYPTPSNIAILAKQYEYNQMKPEAIATAKTVIENDPSELGIFLDALYTMSNCGDLDSALEALRKGREWFPQDYYYLDNQTAEFLVRQKKYDEAIEIYKKLADAPDHEGSRVYNQAHIALLRITTAKDAETIKENIVFLIKAEEGGYSSIASDLLSDISTYYNTRNEEANKHYILMIGPLEEALNGKNKLYHCRLLLANLYEKAGQPDKARPIILDVLPKLKTSEGLISLAYTCEYAKDYSLEVEIYKTIVTIEPDNSHLKTKLASAYTLSGDKMSAVGIYNNVIDANPTDISVLYTCAYEMFDSGLKNESLNVYLRVVSLLEKKLPEEELATNSTYWSCLRGITEIYSARNDKAHTLKFVNIIKKRIKTDYAEKYVKEKLKSLGS